MKTIKEYLHEITGRHVQLYDMFGGMYIKVFPVSSAYKTDDTIWRVIKVNNQLLKLERIENGITVTNLYSINNVIGIGFMAEDFKANIENEKLNIK